MTPLDHQRLQEALQLAEGSFGLCDPNPRVGCIIGTADGRVFGRGATQAVGADHAEVMALRDAQGQHHELRGATAWVTLEPCAHHGRTPPCCDALIDAGIGRVVVAQTDPYPKVNGNGISRLRTAGVEVEVASGAAAAAAAEINIGFLSRVLRDRPWVRLKVAASLDGKTALPNGRSQWITGEAARQDGHRWRHRASAVLTGIGTVRADDPRLDARGSDFSSHPLRVVLDSAFSLPIGSRLLQPPGGVLVVGAADPAQANPALRATAAELISLPSPEGRVDLRALLLELGRRGINELHVEAGAVLGGALLLGGWVDEVLMYQAPTLLGPGQPMLEMPALQTLEAAPRLELVSIGRLGPDIALRLQTSSGAQFRLRAGGRAAPLGNSVEGPGHRTEFHQ